MPRKILTPEERRTYARDWRRRNRDRINKSVREWKKAHPDATKKANNDYIKKHPEKRKEYYEKYLKDGSTKRSRLKSRYGVTPEQVKEMLVSQNYTCPICLAGFEDTTPHIDHCHTTRKFRGLLHISCNTMLGNAKDIPERLERAAQYLRNSNQD